MTPAQKLEADRLQKEIKTLQDREQLTADTFKSFQSSVFSLIAQGASGELIEENRDKATFYYEAFLDLHIHIGKLTRQLSELTK